MKWFKGKFITGGTPEPELKHIPLADRARVRKEIREEAMLFSMYGIVDDESEASRGVGLVGGKYQVWKVCVRETKSVEDLLVICRESAWEWTKGLMEFSMVAEEIEIRL